ARVLLLHDGLLGLVLGLLHRIDAEVEQIFLADGRTGGDTEEPNRHPLALERSHSDFALGARHDVRLPEIVPDIVLDRGTGRHRVFHKDIADDALVTQLELDRADHANAKTLDAVDLIA